MQVKYLFIFTAIIAEFNFITVDGSCSSEEKNFLQRSLDKAIKLKQQQIQYETDDEEDEDDWDDERDTSTTYSLNSSISSDDTENNNKNIVKPNKDDFKNKMLILERNMAGSGNVNSKKDQENDNIAQVIETKEPKSDNIMQQNYIEQQKYNEGSILKNNVVIDDNLLKKISEYKVAKSNYDKNPSNSEVNKLLELANAIITGNASLEVVRSYEMSKRYYNLNMHNGRESRKAIKKLLNFIDDFIDKLIEQKSSKEEIYKDEIKENIIDHLNDTQVSKEENTTKYSVQQQKQLEQLESICDRILQYMKESNSLLSDMIQKRQ